MLLAAGYKAFEPKKAYAPGEKVYFIQENKAVVAATIGQKPYEEGFRLVIAHIDCPRLDLRPNPLYESDHMSYFRTHYYGQQCGVSIHAVIGLDLGGGGTIAKYVANRGIKVLDMGVPVLSMHSPFEVIHKTDLYMAYRTFSVFCQSAD